ncbi:MAG: bifunctional precorrin-2 dehydrogenase/sirohydrochlorin ferrochelatase [Chloroflexota bacterium]
MKAEDQTSGYYPLFLDLAGKRCLVVGGGEVARRKVMMLLEYGGSVEVISPELCPELAALANSGQVTATRRQYRNDDLKNASLAIAATGHTEVNRQVAAEARRQKVLVNVVDDPEISDFIVPSYLRRGDITVAVSTSGKSPALARKIRTRLETDLGKEYAALADLIAEVRAEVKRQKIKVDSDGWQEALDLDSLTGLLRAGQRDKARDIMLSRLTGLAQPTVR